MRISKKLSNSNNKYLVLQQFLPPNGTIGLKSTSEKFLVEFQKKYNSFSDNEVREILNKGAERVRPFAVKTIKKVKKRIGIK